MENLLIVEGKWKEFSEALLSTNQISHCKTKHRVETQHMCKMEGMIS